MACSEGGIDMNESTHCIKLVRGYTRTELRKVRNREKTRVCTEGRSSAGGCGNKSISLVTEGSGVSSVYAVYSLESTTVPPLWTHCSSVRQVRVVAL